MDLSQYLQLFLPDDDARADALAHLDAAATRRHLQKGDSLALDAAVDGALVTAGCLRVFITEPDGTERTLYFAPEGWWVPRLDGLDADSSASVAVDALEATEVWLVHRAMLEGAPPPFVRVWRALEDQTVAVLQRRLVGAMRKTAADRYVEFHRLYPGLDARIPQYHVAEYVGISPEFLSKMRARLRRDGCSSSS
jgi:CRP-like cAMP-binding protein